MISQNQNTTQLVPIPWHFLRFEKNARNIPDLAAKARGWDAKYVRAVDVRRKINFDIVAKLASIWDEFSEAQVAHINFLSSHDLDLLVALISPTDLAALSEDIQRRIDFGPKIVDRLKHITVEDVSDWEDAQWHRIPFDNLIAMDWSVLREVPTTEVEKWTKVRKCDHVVCRLVC